MRRIIDMNWETIHIKDDAFPPTLSSEVAQELIKLSLVHRLWVKLIMNDLLIPTDTTKESSCLHIQLISRDFNRLVRAHELTLAIGL